MELIAAEKRASDLRAKGNAKTNSILLEKVSSDCMQANDWLINYAIQLQGETL